MPRLLLLTAGELTRDPRARRAALTAREAGFTVAGVCGSRPGEEPVALDGVEITRVPYGRVSAGLRTTAVGAGTSSTFGRELRGLFRIARLAMLTLKLARAARRADADVIHAHDFETLPAASMLRRRLGARLVYDAHELYADEEPGMPRVYRALVRSLERRLARRSDAVVTVSDPIAAELERFLRLPRRPRVVLNCPFRTKVEPAPRGNGPLRAIYQGATGPGRPVGDLLRAAERAAGAEITIRLVNADLAELRREATASGVDDRVEITDPVPPDRLVEALAGFHVGLVINRPLTRNDELVLPNKLFEYLMAGLAVVVPRLPGLAPLVESEGVGLTYEPGRPDELAAALNRLAAEPETLEVFRRRAQVAAHERFSAEAQSGALLAAWHGR